MKTLQGSVGIENKNNRWRLRLPRAVEASSRYIYTGLEATVDNYRQAKKLGLSIEEEIAAGTFDTTLERYKPKHLEVINKVQSHTLSDLWEWYCKRKETQVQKTTLVREHQTKFKRHIDSLPYTDWRQAQQIAEHLVAEKGAATAKRIVQQLNACCRQAARAGLISHNPFDGIGSDIRVPRKKVGAVESFTKEERDTIIQAFEEHKTHKHYAPFVKFLFYTGCRTGEAVALQWRHISNDCRFVTFSDSYSSELNLRKCTKNGDTRMFPCNEVVRKLLLSIRPFDFKPSDIVFLSPRGGLIDAHNFTNRVWRGNKYGEKEYKGVVSGLYREGRISKYLPTYHTRHTFITLLLDNSSLDAKDIARVVGNDPAVLYRNYASTNVRSLHIPVV